MKVIVWPNPAALGSIGVTGINWHYPQWANLTEAEIVAIVIAQDLPKLGLNITETHVVDKVPGDHDCPLVDGRVQCEFRDAWEWTDRISVNMPKARTIHMNRIRVYRNAELEKESGSKDRQPAEIEALFTPERQARLQELRDIPQTFDLAKYRVPGTLKAA